MKRSVRASLLLGLAAALVAGWASREHWQPSAEPSSTRSSIGVATPSTEGATRLMRPDSMVRASGLPPAGFTMPPTGVPIGSAWPGLVAAARAGYAPAMCRLAFELNRCSEQSRWWDREFNEQMADMALYSEHEPSDQTLQQYQRSIDLMAEKDIMCKSVVAPPGMKPWRLLRDAARSGHVPSMVRFSTEFPVDRTLRDTESFVALRDESNGFLQRAAAAGDARAAYFLFWGYSGNGSNFTPLKENPKLAFVYALALRGVGDANAVKQVARGVVTGRLRLTPAEIADAERQAARLTPAFAGLVGAPLNLQSNHPENGEDCDGEDWRDRVERQRKPPA